VKNLTALGKYLILTVLLGSLGACSSTSPYQQSASIVRSAEIDYANNANAFTLLYNLGKYQYFRLTEEQKRKQSGAVYAALNSEYGTIYNWYESNAMGAVKAVHGYPQSSGFCKVIYSQIIINNKERTFEETACRDVGHEGWRFIVK